MENMQKSTMWNNQRSMAFPTSHVGLALNLERQVLKSASDCKVLTSNTCYAQNYAVYYRDTSGKIFMATVFVDGYKCGGRIVRKSVGYLDGIYTSATTSRPFIFSRPNFTGKNDHFHPL